MENVLEEFFTDALADAAMYNDENFEAFESDEDSMLILGQPIDDQITTKNLPSFAIPQKTREDGSPGSDEECEYEDSFESATKSPTHAHPLNEMSSITFMHSKADPTTHEFPPVIYEKPTGKKKGKKKKKRVPPVAALTGTAPQYAEHSHTQAVPIPRKGSSGTNMPDIRTSAAQHPQAAVSQSGSRAGVRGHHTPSTVSAGYGGSIASAAPSSASARAVRSGSSRPDPRTAQPLYPAHSVQAQQYSDPSAYNHATAAVHSHAQYPHTHPTQPAQYALQGQPSLPSRPPAGVSSSITSQMTAQSNAVRHQGAVYTNAVLQRQLDNALKQVAIYRRENEALQHSLDSAGINEAVERYKALLIEKENRIHQLESENTGLKSIARYQGKYLSEQAHQPTGVDSLQNHEKQIEIMLIHTRKMKEKAKRLEQREQELLAENEHLHTQNGRIQRKNLKLRKQLTELAAALQRQSKQGGAEQQGAVSTSILDSLDREDTAAAGAERSPQDSSGDLRRYLGDRAEGAEGGSQEPAQAKQSTTTAGAPMTKAALRKALAEREAQLQKQQSMVEALERSLQSQRGRFVREIEQLKQQVAQGVEERRRLEAELEKRERFGRNQVSTLKQIRLAYDELSSGYRKLLTASELYNRDTAPPVQRPREEEPTRAQPVKPLSPLGDTRKLAPKAGRLSEHDDISAGTEPYAISLGQDNVSQLSPASSTTLLQHPPPQTQAQVQTQAHLVPVRPAGSAGGSRVGSARQLAANLVQSLQLQDTLCP